MRISQTQSTKRSKGDKDTPKSRNPLIILICSEDYGAPTRTRTADLLITNQLLYQLSYRGTFKHGTPLMPRLNFINHFNSLT